MERSQWETGPPSVCIAFGGQKIMSDQWNFLVRALCLSPNLPVNPFLTVSPPMHTLTQTHAHVYTHLHTYCNVTREHTNAHTCALCHPAQWLGALAKFLNPPPAFGVGGSGLPENNGID